MKKMNLLAMSLVSAAALSFSSCSNNDDLTGGSGTQSKVEGFYMTLAVQTPTSNGTRTQQQTEKVDATEAETKLTSGTLYLVDATGKVVFTKTISEAEWSKAAPESPTTGKTEIQVPVQNVTEGTTYKVYFLANTTNDAPWANTAILTSATGFAGDYATKNKFAMFNQNDNNSHADQYTVTFTQANKETPATLDKPIQLDRITARIDKPTSVEAINGAVPEGATALQKKAIADAKEKVKSITLTHYAITNLPNKTYIMQNWGEKWAALQIPTAATGFTYMQQPEGLGGKYSIDNETWFTDAAKNYVFENTAGTPTTMYFEYTVALDETKFTDTPDCTDKTFYRYNGNIYRSIQAIYDAYKDQPVLFGGKTAAELKAELKIADGKIGASETELAAFRENNVIEVFVGGKTYFSQVITDNWLKTNTIQRNTVYRLNVKNIFNVGADVPNGDPVDNKPMYYLDVEVSVNPWVLSTQDVELK